MDENLSWEDGMARFHYLEDARIRAQFDSLSFWDDELETEWETLRKVYD